MNTVLLSSILSSVDYDYTKKIIWKNYRNPKDRFLVDYSFTDENGRESKNRMTTDCLQGFIEYLFIEDIKWKYLNVHFRYAVIMPDKTSLRIGQIASYTKRYLPKDSIPPIQDVERMAKRLTWKPEILQAVTAYKQLVLNQITDNTLGITPITNHQKSNTDQLQRDNSDYERMKIKIQN